MAAVTLLPTETRGYIVANGDALTARLYNDNDNGVAMGVYWLAVKCGGVAARCGPFTSRYKRVALGCKWVVLRCKRDQSPMQALEQTPASDKKRLTSAF